MAPLHMKGRQINSIRRFYEYFSLEEILAQREAFSAFAKAQLRLGDEETYLVAVFIAAAENALTPEDAFQDDFWSNPLKLCEGAFLNHAQGTDASGAAAYSVSENNRLLTHTVFGRIVETTRSNVEKRRLYYLAVSALLLAQADASNLLLELEPVFRLINGDTVNKQEDEPADSTVKIEPNQTQIVLASGKMVYWMDTFTEAKLGDGQTISVISVRAIFGPAAGKYSCVLLRLRTKGAEDEAVEIQLQPGEYRYFLCADGRVIKPLPTSVESGGRSLTREDLSKDELIYRTNEGTTRKLPSSGIDAITAFCVEPDSDGYLLVYGNRLDASRFSCYQSYPEIQLLENRNIVDVLLHEGDYLMLQANGRVFSSRSEWDALRNVAALEDVVGQKRMGGREL